MCLLRYSTQFYEFLKMCGENAPAKTLKLHIEKYPWLSEIPEFFEALLGMDDFPKKLFMKHLSNEQGKKQDFFEFFKRKVLKLVNNPEYWEYLSRDQWLKFIESGFLTDLSLAKNVGELLKKLINKPRCRWFWQALGSVLGCVSHHTNLKKLANEGHLFDKGHLMRMAKYKARRELLRSTETDLAVEMKFLNKWPLKTLKNDTKILEDYLGEKTSCRAISTYATKYWQAYLNNSNDVLRAPQTCPSVEHERRIEDLSSKELTSLVEFCKKAVNGYSTRIIDISKKLKLVRKQMKGFQTKYEKQLVPFCNLMCVHSDWHTCSKNCE